jgi:hypothetical protein
VDYTGIRVVAEIRLGVDDDYNPVQLVNAYLDLGWIILGVHQRAYQSDTVMFQTVYILGSFDERPRYPETDATG